MLDQVIQGHYITAITHSSLYVFTSIEFPAEMTTLKPNPKNME